MFFPVTTRKYKDRARTFADGSMQKVDAGDIADARFEYNKEWTLIQFFNVTSSTTDERTLFSKWGGDGTTDQIRLRIDNDVGRDLLLGINGDVTWSFIDNTISAHTDKWLVVCVRNNTTRYYLSLYDLKTRNLIATTDKAAPITNEPDLTEPIQFGLRMTDQDEYDGSLSHVAYFSEFLNIPEILKFMRDPQDVISRRKCVFGYRFDESGSFERDYSGKGNHGTASTSPAPGIGDFPSNILESEIIYIPLAAAAGAITGTIASTLDDFTSAANGQIEHVGSIAETLDDFTPSANGVVEHVGSIAETLDDFTSTANGEVHHVGSIAETLDDFISTANGVVGEDIVGTIAVTLEDFTPAANGLIEHVGSIAVTLEAFSPAANGVIEHVGSIDSTLEDFTSSITGTLPNLGFPTAKPLTELKQEPIVTTLRSANIKTGLRHVSDT